MKDIQNKELRDMKVTGVHRTGDYCELRLTPCDGILPDFRPGQFVNILVPTRETFLRRPISVNDVDVENNELRLLVKDAGRGTHVLCESKPGDVFNVLMPLGHGFTVESGKRYLLTGGGVGTAPLLYLGRCLKAAGSEPVFLLGARTAGELLQLEDFSKLGEVHLCTEDGSVGVKGFVTAHPEISRRYDRCCVCGPAPMMKAVAAVARQSGTPCEVSLENKMACGLGACLCCVEDTKEGNRCTCTDGPVFNIDELTNY